MKIAYTEVAGRQFWHVGEVDGTFLAQQGDDILFRETRLVTRESVPAHDGYATQLVDVIPPRTDILSEHPVADWFEVNEDLEEGVYRLEDIRPKAA